MGAKDMNTIWRKLSADAGEGGSREATNGVGDASKLHIGISMGLQRDVKYQWACREL